MNILQNYEQLIFVVFFTVGVFTSSFMATSFICDMIW
jgi:hypothetical protein